MPSHDAAGDKVAWWITEGQVKTGKIKWNTSFNA